MWAKLFLASVVLFASSLKLWFWSFEIISVAPCSFELRMTNILFFGVRNITSRVILITKVVVQFVDSFGTKEDIKKAEARHREHFPSPKSPVESKKRPSMDISAPDRAKVHKPYVGVTATAGPAGPPAYNNGQAQWNAFTPQPAYSQQPQGWQQPPLQQLTPPVQPQQWNQSYGSHQVRFQSHKFVIFIILSSCDTFLGFVMYCWHVMQQKTGFSGTQLTPALFAECVCWVRRVCFVWTSTTASTYATAAPLRWIWPRISHSGMKS